MHELEKKLAAPEGLRTTDLFVVLKRRMQLKRMEIRIGDAVSWNLGYCPSDIWFDELLDKRNDLSLIVSKTDPEWFAIYDRFRDADNCKRLMIFLPTNDAGETRRPKPPTGI